MVYKINVYHLKMYFFFWFDNQNAKMNFRGDGGGGGGGGHAGTLTGKYFVVRSSLGM